MSVNSKREITVQKKFISLRQLDFLNFIEEEMQIGELILEMNFMGILIMIFCLVPHSYCKSLPMEA